jgi:hypothetical protein
MFQKKEDDRWVDIYSEFDEQNNGVLLYGWLVH